MHVRYGISVMFGPFVFIPRFDWHQACTASARWGDSFGNFGVLIGPVAMATRDSAIKAPGMMRRHYAPHLPLHLNAQDHRSGEALLGFGRV